MKKSLVLPVILATIASGCNDVDVVYPENLNQAPIPPGAVGVPDADNTSTPKTDPFVADLVTKALSRQYMMTGFSKINADHYPSTVSDGKVLDVYIDNGNLDSYLKIDPNQSGSLAEVTQGTMIVREVWTPELQMDKYTVMVKMERGYFPGGGDFFYAVFSMDGTVEQSGKLEGCGGCHAGRADDGFLFGVPSQYRGGQPNEQDADARLEALARAVVVNKSHLGTGFKKINSISYASALNSQQLIDVYVSAFGADNYNLVAPEKSDSNAQLPEETVIVREVKNLDGEFEKYTVMVKGPVGYFPNGGDFYYGVFDAEGNVINDAGGQAQSGALAVCGSCHLPRSGDGFLYGVPAEYKTK